MRPVAYNFFFYQHILCMVILCSTNISGLDVRSHSNTDKVMAEQDKEVSKQTNHRIHAAKYLQNDESNHQLMLQSVSGKSNITYEEVIRPDENNVSGIDYELQGDIGMKGLQKKSSSRREEALCRYEMTYLHGRLLPLDLFSLVTCSRCYTHTFPFHPLTLCPGYTLCDKNNTSIRHIPHADDNFTSPVYKTLSNEKEMQQWKDCCQAASTCCQLMMTMGLSDYNGCPRTWDGWQCWDSTRPGETAVKQCPNHIFIPTDNTLDTHGVARKQCTTNGTWYIKYEKNCTTGKVSTNEYTDYENCYAVKLNDILLSYNVHVGCYVVSVFSLFCVLVIYFSDRDFIKQKRIPGKRKQFLIHINLCVSFMLHGSLFAPYYWYYMRDATGINGPCRRFEQNDAGCKIFKLLVEYLRICKYMWMFCEGYEIFVTVAGLFNIVSKMPSTFLLYNIIGWVLALIPVSTYGILKWTSPDENERCWLESGNGLEWILSAPCLAALLLNFFMLIAIVGNVCQLQRVHGDVSTRERRAARITLALIPVLGLHEFLFIPKLVLDMDDLTLGNRIIYDTFVAVLGGIQGFIIAIKFTCFDRDLRESWKRRQARMSRGSFRSSSMRTGSFRLSGYRSSGPQASNNTRKSAGNTEHRAETYPMITSSPDKATASPDVVKDSPAGKGTESPDVKKDSPGVS